MSEVKQMKEVKRTMNATDKETAKRHVNDGYPNFKAKQREHPDAIPSIKKNPKGYSYSVSQELVNA